MEDGTLIITFLCYSCSYVARNYLAVWAVAAVSLLNGAPLPPYLLALGILWGINPLLVQPNERPD